MKQILILWVLILLTACHGEYDVSDENSDVDNYVGVVLSTEREPTLSDYQRFNGHGSESELELVLEYCEENSWLPTATNAECIRFVRHREENSSGVASLYFQQLRRLLPLDPAIQIDSIERYHGDETLEHEIITARLNDVEIAFIRFISEHHRYEFGEISVSKINGVQVSNMF